MPRPRASFLSFTSPHDWTLQPVYEMQGWHVGTLQTSCEAMQLADCKETICKGLARTVKQVDGRLGDHTV